MSPEEIKALQKELSCTARELAATLGVDQATVLAWEASALFPTKALVDRMSALRAKGPGAVVRRGKAGADLAKGLADPLVWSLLRKLLAHKTLRDKVTQLAEGYPDPADVE